MKYPQFCCVSFQKSISVKLPLVLCAEIPLRSRPSGAVCSISAPQRSALCRWLLGARVVIGHRTVALRHRQYASAPLGGGGGRGVGKGGRGRGSENATKGLKKKKKTTTTKN